MYTGVIKQKASPAAFVNMPIGLKSGIIDPPEIVSGYQNAKNVKEPPNTSIQLVSALQNHSSGQTLPRTKRRQRD